MSLTYDFSIFGTPFFQTGILVLTTALSVGLCVVFFRFLREPNDSVFTMICFSAFFVAACVSMSVFTLHSNAESKLSLFENEAFHNLSLPKKTALLEEEFKARLANAALPRKTVSGNDVAEGRAHIARMSEEELVKAIDSVESTMGKRDVLLERYR